MVTPQAFDAQVYGDQDQENRGLIGSGVCASVQGLARELLSPAGPAKNPGRIDRNSGHVLVLCLKLDHREFMVQLLVDANSLAEQSQNQQ
jgi:hypothetical protein